MLALAIWIATALMNVPIPCAPLGGVAFAQSGGDAALVVTFRGARNDTTTALKRLVRRRLADEVGPLRSSRDWSRKLRALGLTGRQSHRAVNMARAARLIGAAHVLDIKAFQQDGRPTMKVRLIRARDGLIRMRRHIPYRPDGAPAAQLTDRVVELTLLSLARDGVSSRRSSALAAGDDTTADSPSVGGAALGAAAGGAALGATADATAGASEQIDRINPADGVATLATENADTPTPPILEDEDGAGTGSGTALPSPVAELTVPASPDQKTGRGPEGEAGAPPALDGQPNGGSSSSEAGAPPALDGQPDGESSSNDGGPPTLGTGSGSSPDGEPGAAIAQSASMSVGEDGATNALTWYSPEGGGSTTATLTAVLPTTSSRPAANTLDLTIAFGSGLYRDYALSASGIDASQVSHRIAPVPLFRGAVRLTAPVGIGVQGDVGFRSVNYEIRGQNIEEESVRGQLIETDLGLIWRFMVGRADIVPKLGARISMSIVESQAETYLPSATSVAPIVGLDFAWVGQGWDLRLGADAGWVLRYSERPDDTGDDGQGPTVGGRAGLTVWVTESLGIGLDTLFTADLLTFEGEPSRDVPPSEQAQLVDASLTIMDWRATGGVRLRL